MVTHTTETPPSDFIRIYDNNLTEEFCDYCIELFEKDHRKTPGVTGRGYVPEVKDSLDLLITGESGWEAVDTLLHAALSDPAQDYFSLLDTFKHTVYNPRDTGYQIQKTVPGGGYTWHNDSFVYDDCYERVFTYIWYLNTIEDGGETEFLDRKIQPVAGRLVLFPATWTYLHRGHAPNKGSKYICTGWMMSSPFPKEML